MALTPFQSTNRSWIGWFPVLFYTTLWVSGIYKQNLASSSGVDPLDTEEEGTRAGNRALLYSSIIAMLGFIILPVMISSTDSHPNVRTVSSVSLSAGHSKQENSNPYAIQNEKRKKGWYQVSMHVATLWCISNAVFAVAMFATWIIGDKVWGANLIIGMTGFSWAVSLWAPFALVSSPPIVLSMSAMISHFVQTRTDRRTNSQPVSLKIRLRSRSRG
jgi:solute carrier family 45 protein 1/2/4